MTHHLEQKIAEIIAPALADIDLRPLHVEFIQNNATGRILQVLLEGQDGRNPTIDECTDATHEISTLLDVEDLIQGKYQLEVSSPGIDRPLVRIEDFERYIGHEAKIELATPQSDGRKRYRGVITGVTEANNAPHVKIQVDHEKYDIEFGNIGKAKLVLTDRLIEETAQQQKKLQA